MTREQPRSIALAFNRFAVRLLAVLGLIGCLFNLPGNFLGTATTNIGLRIERGEDFKPSLLSQISEYPGKAAVGRCDRRFLLSLLLVRLRSVEKALELGELDRIDAGLNLVKSTAIESISCSPGQAFAWLALFWARNLADGFRNENLALLEAAYKYGPHEGWIALSRNPMAFRLFPQLPPALQETVLAEFAGLLGAQQFDAAISIFAGAASPYAQRILPLLAPLPFQIRLEFARRLARADIIANVPGIELKNPAGR
jgi:hypothetical protein